MAFLNFPDTLYFKTIDTSETVKMGAFTFASDTRLQYARVMFYLHGSSITTEKFRINVMPGYGQSTPIYQSDWSDLSDISNIATNWIGWVRFDFSTEFVDSDHTYYLELEPANYTRSGDTFYIGVALEYSLLVNDDFQTVDHNLPVGVECYGVS